MKLSWTVVLSFLIFVSCADYDVSDIDVPPEAVHLDVIGAADSTVTLRWTQSHDDYFKQYRIYYSATSDVVDTVDKLSDTLNFSQDTVKIVHSLDSDKHYFFRVIVLATTGLVSASNVVDTTTLKNVNDMTLVLLKPDTIADTAIALRWEKSWVTPESKFGIFMDTTATVDTTDSLVQTINDGTTVVISKLKRSAKYWFKVFLQRGSYFYAGSKEQGVTMPSGAPVAPVLAVIRSSISDSSVNVAWNKNRKEFDIWRYWVWHDTVKITTAPDSLDTTDSRLSQPVNLLDTTARVQGLLGDKKYYFAVFVEDSSKLITMSNVDTATTNDGMPSPVRLSLTDATDSTMEIHWSPNKESDLAGYQIFVSPKATVDTTDSLKREFKNPAEKDTSLTIEMKTGARQFWCVVYVKNKSGSRVASNRVVNYPFILSLDTTDKLKWNDSTIAVQWSPSRTPLSDFVSYKVFLKDKPGIKDVGEPRVEFTLISTHYYATTTNIDSGKTYFLRVFENVKGSDGMLQTTGSNEISVFTINH